MRLLEFIRSPAVTCETAMTLSDAARLMHLREVGCLVVVDDSGHVAGIVTDRDLALKGYGQDRASSTAVAEIMTRHPLTMSIDSDTNDAATAMMHHGVRRLPVIDADGTLRGVIALDDLVMFNEHEAEMLRRALESQTRKDAPGWSGEWD